MTDFEQMLAMFQHMAERERRDTGFFQVLAQPDYGLGTPPGTQIYLTYARIRFHFDEHGHLWDIEGQ